MTNTEKSPGQIAYEASVAACPTYHDGSPRRTWEQLGDVARWSWERQPSEPREWIGARLAGGA